MTDGTQLKKVRGMEVVIRHDERDRVLAKIGHLLDRGWLMWGDEQEEFQGRFVKLTGRKHAVTYCSATLALEVTFRFLATQGLRTVAMQANNFPSPAMAARRAGLTVSWIDIDVDRLCPSVEDLEAAYKKQPFEILSLTWIGGFISAQVLDIVAWCEKHSVVLIEDASHAAGSFAQGKPAGSFGEVAVFSLAATKALHTGQGGMLVTDVGELAEIAFQSKNYGRTEMFQKGQYVVEGFNAHMTEMQAALGNVLTESMPDRITERAKWAKLYRAYLDRCGIKALGDQTDQTEPNFYKYPVLLPKGKKDLAALRAFMAERAIELGSSMYDFVTPALPVWGADAVPVEQFPKTVEYSQRHTCLPMHNALTRDDIERVGAALLEFYVGG